MYTHRRALMYALDRVYTVNDCIALGYFKQEGSTIFTNKVIPFEISKIIDFKEEFMGTYTNRMFVLSDSSHLNTEQQEYIIDIYNNNVFENRKMNQISLKNFNLPNKDVYIRRGSDTKYDYHHDFARDATFNSITIDLVNGGNISSMNNLFRGAKFKNITFVQEVTPVDISGIFEWNNILTAIPNNINWCNCENICYAFETCRALTEIPSYKDVTDEESRITLKKNIIGITASHEDEEDNLITNTGIRFSDQTFNQCSGITKVGPVLDMKGVTITPTNMFNDCMQIKDIRIKNLNCDFNFAKNEWQGLPNMDVDSIMYCINNLMQQETGVTKTIKFGDLYYSELLNTITSELLNEINNKGWLLYIGDNEITTDILTN